MRQLLRTLFPKIDHSTMTQRQWASLTTTLDMERRQPYYYQVTEEGTGMAGSRCQLGLAEIVEMQTGLWA